MASSPRINTQLGARQTLELRRKARLPVHRPSACSGVKALRNTSDARRQAAKLCYRFGPLTPSARSGNLIAGDGTKNGLPAPNKELTANPKQPLDRKSPIQVSCEPDFLDHGWRRRSLPVQSRAEPAGERARSDIEQCAEPTRAEANVDLIGSDVDAVDQGGNEVAALRRGPPSSIHAGMPGRVPALPGFPLQCPSCPLA